MAAADQLQLAPIPTTIDNPDEWEAITQQITAEAGLPTEVTPDLVSAMVGSAVPLLFEAHATGNMDLLRGTFSDQVIAQCERSAGYLAGEQPTSAAIHLIGAPMVDGHPVLRTKLVVQVQGADGAESADPQFWDFQLGAQVTVGQPSCPNCGAPVEKGQLICGHCRTDVRSLVQVPLVVSKLEVY